MNKTRADHIYMARVYLSQAREEQHQGWKATLLEWAGNRRRAAMKCRKVQGDLFA